MAVYDRDYLTTLPLLYEKANEYSAGDWNKYNDDVGDTMLKLLASASHAVDYYFRTFLNALFLPNDDWDMKALIWELTGYKPNYLRADYLMVQLYWPDCGLLSYVPIYQYTPFKITADGKEYIFLCAEDYFIPPRTTRTNVRLVNGSLETISMISAKVVDNKIKLSDNDIDYDLVTLKVSGEKWTQVRNVYYSPDTTKIFSLHKEEDGTWLYLHKTWKEYVDAYDDNVTVYFVESSYDFEMYTDDCMTVEFNAEILTLDGEDVSQYYKIIPLLNSDEALSASILMPSTTEGNRAITTLDYESNAKLFPGIVCSKAYDWNTPQVSTVPFEVAVIACDKTGSLSDHMKLVLKAYLESIGSPLITVRLVEPMQRRQNMIVVLDIGEYRGTLVERQIRSIVSDTLKEFYALGNLEPGRVVKNKELNSLLMHADQRIYFANVEFLNAIPHDPRIIPILGSVIIITSATTLNSYDFGFGADQMFIGPRGIDHYYFNDMISPDGFLVFFKDSARVNELAPIDKLPLEVFDSGTVGTTIPTIALGTRDFVMISDFGVGEDYACTVQTGGSSEIGPVYVLIFETTGESVIGTLETNLSNACMSDLEFSNVTGIVNVDPEIGTLDLISDDETSVKEALATAFNAIPGLQNISVTPPEPFNITGADIYSGTVNTFGGSRVTRKLQSDDLLGASYETAVDAKKALKTANLDETGVSDEFVYLPYSAPLGAAMNEDFTDTSYSAEFRKSYTDLKYPAPSESILGRYTPNIDAYGPMKFTATVNTRKVNTATFYKSNAHGIYEMFDVYSSVHFITTKHGLSLNWYLVSTNPVHDVNNTVHLGYGIFVFFELTRDTGLYVEVDDVTNRAFIYSAEISSDQLTVTDSWENFR